MEYCEFITLHHNEHGFVVLCKHCRSYQIAFGNMQLNFLPAEFKTFRKHLQQLNLRYTDVENPFLKQVQIPTDSAKVLLLLSPEELGHLTELTEQSMLLDEIYETLYLHKS